VERFFRSLKEECAWQHNFSCFAEADVAALKVIHLAALKLIHPKLDFQPTAS